MRQLTQMRDTRSIHPVIVIWICSYLTHRSQRVVVASPEVHAVPGAPQGSVLGPLLFLLSMNGFTQLQLVANSKRILYADDIVLYKPIKTVSDYIHIQEDHALIQKMSEDSRLVFNPKKLKFYDFNKK